MAKFLLQPKDFQKQVDSLKKNTATVKELKYQLEKDGVSLESIDKFEECINAMNDLIAVFGEYAEKDCNTLEQVKAKWMNTDEEMATKTILQILTSGNTDK